MLPIYHFLYVVDILQYLQQQTLSKEEALENATKSCPRKKQAMVDIFQLF
jgi:hypothetical protein